MSMLVTRSPLLQIEMNGAGTTRRRSSRLSQEGTEEIHRLSKRSANIATKSHDGASNGVSGAGAGTRKGKKRKSEYTEEDDGFSFARKTRSRKSVAVPELDTVAESHTSVDVPEPAPAQKQPQSTRQKQPRAKPRTDTIPEEEEEEEEESTSQTIQKKTRRPLPTTPEHKASTKPVRRSKRFSEENRLDDATSPHKAAHAKSHAVTDGRSPSPSMARPVTVEKKRKTTNDGRGVEEEKVMRIALPFADTPIIRRNKEMRKTSSEKGGRRSSGSLRGRRASSMIDGGRGNAFAAEESISTPFIPMLQFEDLNAESHIGYGSHSSDSIKEEDGADSPVRNLANGASGTALPHPEVQTSELYKHIAEELTEPRRMRCLLGWCGSRVLPPKPDPPQENTSEKLAEFQASQAALAIQEELAQELVSNGLLSDWFSRDEQAPPIKRKKKPNPRNIANLAKAEELERQLDDLKKERAAWDELGNISEQQTELPQSTQGEDGAVSPLRLELLDSPERALLEKLQADGSDNAQIDASEVGARLRNVVENLEFSIDSFAAGVHQLATTAAVADTLAKKTLGGAAEALEQRELDRRKNDSGRADLLGTLNGLSRVLNGSQKTRQPKPR